jgi:hypothetical protein
MAIAAASADSKDVFGKNGLFDELKKGLGRANENGAEADVQPRLRPSLEKRLHAFPLHRLGLAR